MENTHLMKGSSSGSKGVNKCAPAGQFGACCTGTSVELGWQSWVGQL